MPHLTVDLGERSYPIIINEGFERFVELYQHLALQKRVFVVTNETVAPLYLDSLLEQLSQLNCDYNVCILPDGEAYKSFEQYQRITTELIQSHHKRNSSIVALGGGVVGDITGFAAATFQRGAQFIQIPTTLLSQVDSSVGGKTAINHPLGKNLIGAFYQPKFVYINAKTLHSLPKREFNAGMAEVIKYGMIHDSEFFEWIENHISSLHALESQALSHVILRSCDAKAKIVAEDELERNRRAILNLGHTFGHAIEAICEYKDLVHGEAVALGMVMATAFAAEHQLCDKALVERLERLLQAFQLPTRLASLRQYTDKPINAKLMIQAMLRDKKNTSERIKLILPVSLGKVKITEQFESQQITNFLCEFGLSQ
ncbi:MAG: 3-dehydroquinate synthase [Pseudomonadota bacterium]